MKNITSSVNSNEWHGKKCGTAPDHDSILAQGMPILILASSPGDDVWGRQTFPRKQKSVEVCLSFPRLADNMSQTHSLTHAKFRQFEDGSLGPAEVCITARKAGASS